MAESSLVAGPVQDPLLSLTLGDLLEKQERLFGLLDAVVCPETRARLTYADLNARTKLVARALIHHGIKAGDRIAIFSGNCERYVELFFAASRIGAIAVVLNNTYTESECLAAIRHTGRLSTCLSISSTLIMVEQVVNYFSHHLISAEEISPHCSRN